MKADAITVERVRDLRDVLADAVESMEALWLDLEFGDVTTEHAATVIDETIRKINAAAR